MRVTFTRSVLVNSEHQEIGSTLSVPDELGVELIAIGCAKEADAEPAPATDEEPATKKPKK